MDCDYGYQLTREPNVLRGRVESAREFLRIKAAPRRMFAAVFAGRPRADYVLIENFRHKMLADFFTYHDKESALGAFAGRKYSVIFHSEPVVQVRGFNEYDIRCELIEQVGAAMATYPTFGGDYPSINVLVAAWEDLGGSGKQLIYAGYGFRVNGSFTSIFLDEVDVTAGGATQTSVPLGLHRLRVTGGPPTSADYLI